MVPALALFPRLCGGFGFLLIADTLSAPELGHMGQQLKRLRTFLTLPRPSEHCF